MKKLLLSLVMLAGLATTTAHAQATGTNTSAPVKGDTGTGASFTIKGGGSYSGFTGDGVAAGSSYRPDYFGGLGLDLPLNNTLSVAVEALYTRKGAKFDNPAAGGAAAFTSTTVLQYVDVPLLARLHSGGLFFEVGPQLGVLVDAKDQRDNTLDRNVLTSYNVLDFGYVGGLGFASDRGLGIGARYNSSFSGILKNSATLPTTTRNSAFQLYLSFTFRDR